MKSVVLLSGGLDSTVNLFAAQRAGKVLLALTFNYQQRAARKEIASAKALAEHLNVTHEVVDLGFFKSWNKSSLINTQESLPLKSDVSIDDMKISSASAKSVWVPNRNGIFLNIAAGFAEALGADVVVPGFNKEEAQTFPDNSSNFMEVLTKSFTFSTANHVEVHCETVGLDKTQIVQLGNKLGVPWNMIWPCYQGGEKWCGHCESCKRSQRAFAANHMKVFDENKMD